MSFSFITTDIVLLIAIFIIFAVISFYSGTKLITQSVVSFYIATYIHTNLSQFQDREPREYIIGYIIVFAIVFFLTKRYIKGRKSEEKNHRFLEAVLLGLTGTILLLVLNYSILPINALYNFTTPFEKLFTTTVPFGIWLIIPLLLLFITHWKR